MADLTMSQFASKDDLIAAQAVRIAELEAEVDAERHHHGIRNASAVRTLHALGYSWSGTDAWQPPAEQGKCLHQIAEPAAPLEKEIDDAIAALIRAALVEGGCSVERVIEAREQTRKREEELRTLLSTPQPCSRSHPHEEMTPMCELRTEIARLTNALARAEAQLAAAPQEPAQARTLLQEVLNEFCKDGHGGEFEDGEHPLVDRVRAFLAAPQALPQTVPGSKIDLRKMREAALHAQVQGYLFKADGSQVRQVIDLLFEKSRELDAIKAAAPQAVKAAVPKWIDDPHDIEQGQMLNPEWVKLQQADAPAHPAEGVPAPMPVPHPHHCTARTADGSCEECEGHAQAMAEWNAERAAIAATHPTQQGLEPTMFWDADDPERCESSINNVVVEVDNCRGLRVGDIVTIQRAVRLPNLEVRITQCPDAEGNGDLEWDEVVAAQAKQGGV